MKMRLFFVSMIVLSVFALGFIASREFPNGLFSLKLLAAYLAAVLALSAIVILSMFYRCHSIKINPLNFMVFCLLVFIPCCQYFFMDVKLNSLIFILLCYIIFFSINYIGRGLHWLLLMRRFYTLVFIVLMLQIIIGLLQYVGIIYPYHHLSRISGMFFNPGPFAIYFTTLLLFVIPIIFVKIKRRHLKSVILLLTVVLGCSLILIELKSRSAWIGLFVGIISILFLFVWYYGKHWLEHIRKRAIITLAIIIGILCFGGYGLYQVRPESAKGRVLIWKSTSAMICSNLWSGIGIGNFARYYPAYQGGQLQLADVKSNYGLLAGQTEYAFNDLMQLFSEIGIFGILIFISIISFSLFRLIKFIKHKGYLDERFILGSSLIGVLFAIISSGMTSYPLQMVPVAFWFWTIIALINLICPDNYRQIQGKSVPILFVSSAGLALCTLLFFTFKNVKGYYLWNVVTKDNGEITVLIPYLYYMDGEGQLFSEIGTYFHHKKEYSKSIYYFKHATVCQFNRDYYYSLGLSYEKLNCYKEAFATYGLIAEALPSFVKPKYLKAKLFYKLGKLSEFETTAKAIVSMVPKVPNTSTELMIKEIRFLLRKSNTLTNPIL
ncbi:O-antigen ligase family protein [Sphingobacterium sp. 18053]|uniref:O-antigen ligase family protein n=1 Tax=Sphingobacterium sp. 18053 TaxID=2681401 RepID=UPI0013595E53|nr:O-antigen ligase family protein [Sphingobacterium sp. 18053]